MAVFILTGNKRSGKTTTLIEHFANNLKCGGFVSPNRNFLRIMCDLQSQETHPFEIPEHNKGEHKNQVQIGKYTFDLQAFNFALETVKKSIDKNCTLTIIDEFGPLEMDNKGLMPKLGEYLSYFIGNEKNHALIVIREGLVNDFQLQFPEIAVENIMDLHQLASLKARLEC